MLTKLLNPPRRAANERGQVMVIFAFAFVVIVMMLALLFDGARGLVLRRELKNATDAASMAGANIIQSLSPKGCSLTASPPGAPRAEVIAAVQASVAANMPGYPPADVLAGISCGTAADGNNVVRVELGQASTTFFGSIFGGGPLQVKAGSAAINGQDAGNQYSVILLDNSNLSWANGRQGCPSFLLSGGPTVLFDSSIYIDSACARTNGGALSTNGNSASLTLGNNGPLIRITGEYAPGSLTITPAPVEHSAPKPDPIAPKLYQAAWWQPAYTPPLVDNRPPGTPSFLSTDAGSLYVRKTSHYVIGTGSSNPTVVLEPGVYKGGIELRNNSIALLHPGVYVIQGGGLDLGAQSSVYAVDTSVTTVPTNWTDSCHKGSCGVMIYNTGDQNGSLAIDDISVAAGSTFKVRSYDSSAVNPRSEYNNGNPFANSKYDHMLIWQSADPRALFNWAQPEIHLGGGGNVEMIGTVYAPQAKVLMGGNSGGSGGTQLNLTLQFIVWDLELSGNSTFHFVYDGNEFVVPPSYGLTE
jgi:Putative Flp pilus-assembly TadE/G-like